MLKVKCKDNNAKNKIKFLKSKNDLRSILFYTFYLKN